MLFHSLLYSLVDPCMCSHQGSNPQPSCSGVTLKPAEHPAKTTKYFKCNIFLEIYQAHYKINLLRILPWNEMLNSYQFVTFLYFRSSLGSSQRKWFSRSLPWIHIIISKRAGISLMGLLSASVWWSLACPKWRDCLYWDHSDWYLHRMFIFLSFIRRKIYFEKWIDMYLLNYLLLKIF